MLFPALSESAPGCGTRGAVNGTSGNDVLHGTNGANVICGHGGNDAIYGHGGNDTIYGGSGSDKAYAGSGNDRVAGDSGTDVLFGESGDDQVYGGADNDRAYAGSGNDLARGEGGNDYVKGESGNDTAYGDSGADAVYGDQGNDTLPGGSGNDSILGGSGNDTLIGESGTDRCTGEAGYGDTVHDFSCERRGSVEILAPKYKSGLFSCGPTDVSCLAFSGYQGKSVAGFPLQCDTQPGNKHNCTNYAAYRLAARGMTTGFPRGNAYEWDNRRGALTAVSRESPTPGDIAQWESYGGSQNTHAGCNGNCGHVAYVESVQYTATGALSSIVISESSWCSGGKIRKVVRATGTWPTRFLRWIR